ncbi:MAG TPA: TonB-dependent receptor [Bacteroidota bacterium]|nr:TonB-dependent receptor [Bacteroidota bacterium]
MEHKKIQNHAFKKTAIIVALTALSIPRLFSQEEKDRDTVKYTLAPVLVTATEAKERETPVTFTNLNKGLIQQRYSMQDVPVLLAQLPSMISFSDGGNGIGYNYVTLRGFDQSRLSVMVNGIPQNDPEDHGMYWLDVSDILASASNVQVQRGAGSEFYGQAAIGGSINVVTNPFTPKPYVKFESMFGFQQYGDSSESLPMTMKKLSGEFNSGLVDNKYMLYGKLGQINSDGYRMHSGATLDSYFFGALLLGENTTTRIHFFGGPLQDQLVYNGLPKSYNGDLKLRRMNINDEGLIRQPEENEQFTQPHYEVLNEWKISETQKLSNTLFFYEGHGWFDFDENGDTSAFRIDRAHGFTPTQDISTALIRAGIDLAQWGWLPRYEWTHANGELTVGGELRYHHGTHWGQILGADSLPAGYDINYRFYQYDAEKYMASLYTTEVYRLEENISLMANLQFAYNEYRIENEKFLDNAFSYPYYFLNPRFGINYNITDEWNAYVSVAYTSHEPPLSNLYDAENAAYDPTIAPQFETKIVNNDTVYDYTKPLVKPEQLLDFELGAGYKSTELTGTVNVYWMEFTNELVPNGKLNRFGIPIVGNADRTRHIGLELDGAARLPYSFSLSGNISLSSNKIIKETFLDVDSTGTAFATTLDGNPIGGFPGALGNLFLSYQVEKLTATISAKYVGTFYTDNFKIEDDKNDAYTVFNASVLYTLPPIAGASFTLRGEVRNLFNTLYTQTGDGDLFFPAAERNFVIGLTTQL